MVFVGCILTHKPLAEVRILAREGHFYKNSSATDGNESSDNKAEIATGKETDDNNLEWEFHFVDFPHVVLEGSNAVEVNSQHILKYLERQNIS